MMEMWVKMLHYINIPSHSEESLVNVYVTFSHHWMNNKNDEDDNNNKAFEEKVAWEMGSVAE